MKSFVNPIIQSYEEFTTLGRRLTIVAALSATTLCAAFLIASPLLGFTSAVVFFTSIAANLYLQEMK